MNKLRALSPAFYDHKWLKIAVGLILACILSPLSISVGTVPITLQTFVLFTITAVLGKKEGTIIAILYLITGALGVPVFSDYSSGWEKFSGPTAGFLLAFPFCCYLLGELIARRGESLYFTIIVFIIVHVLLLAVGFIYMMILVEGYIFNFNDLFALLPGLLIKSVVGGVISFWFLRLREKKCVVNFEASNNGSHQQYFNFKQIHRHY